MSNIMTNEEMVLYVGGASTISASLISSFTKIIKVLYSVGQNLGSSIGRRIRGTSC